MASKKVLIDPTVEKHLHGHDSSITSLSFNPKSQQLVSGSEDHSLVVWNLKEKMRAFKFIGHDGIISDVCFSPTGQLIASASFDRSIRLWQPTVGGNSTKFIAHTKPIQSLHFSHDGSTILTGSNDKIVKEWSVQRRSYLSTFTGHNNWVRSARYSHDSNTIVTASDDKTLKLFDRRMHNCIHTFSEARVPRKAIFHPNDVCVAAAFTEGTIKLYDIRILKQLQLYQCHEGDVSSLDFHPNGNYLYSVSDDSKTKIIDLLEGRALYTLEGKRSSLKAVAASPDGDYFAIGGKDGQISLWKANYEEIAWNEDTSSTVSEDPSITISNVSSLSKNIEELGSNGTVSSENKENMSIADFNALNTTSDSNTKEGLSTQEKLNNLSSKIDTIMKVTLKMSKSIKAIDERCKKLEDLYLK